MQPLRQDTEADAREHVKRQRLVSSIKFVVANERLLSRAGDVITKKRNQLSPSCASRAVSDGKPVG